MALNHLRLLQPLLCRSLISRSRLVVTAVVNVRPSACTGTVHLPAAACRFYGTKKDKAKGPSAKVNIKSALVEDIIDLEELKEEMAAVVYALKDDFTRSLSIRTSPGALDHIIVVTCDGKFPLNELGQISMKSSHLLIVNMSNFPETTHALKVTHTRYCVRSRFNHVPHRGESSALTANRLIMMPIHYQALKSLYQCFSFIKSIAWKVELTRPGLKGSFWLFSMWVWCEVLIGT
ncbi:ribosome-recycling factor, mitochondrial isoform X2 [Oryzias latipes]